MKLSLWRLLAVLTITAATLFSVRPANAQKVTLPPADELLFCNEPERLDVRGVYADRRLIAGRTYRIFFHYRNVTTQTRPLVIAFFGNAGKPFTMDVQKGIADPHNDPPLAGRQAMMRYLTAPAQRLYATKSVARFPMSPGRWEVASGVLLVRADRDVRMQIYFGDNAVKIAGASVVAVPAPYRDIPVMLSDENPRHYARIGQPDATLLQGLTGRMDGAYGLFYRFQVQAPEGRKVRVVFSPRGGHAGLVGNLAGQIFESPIVNAAQWAVFGEALVGKNGLLFRTAPFGGVFYPVEVAFYLI